MGFSRYFESTYEASVFDRQEMDNYDHQSVFYEDMLSYVYAVALYVYVSLY